MILTPEQVVFYAQSIAHAAHKDQVDKLGVPYIRHCEAVATMCYEEWPSDEFKIEGIAVAWLHDVVEDTEVTLDGLSRYFPKSIVKAVDALTKRKGESREAYYSRVKGNWIAHRVKIRDVRHNQSRVHLIEDEATRDRLFMKYLEAEMILGDPDGREEDPESR
jgi:(p)ppGpp synthase/HD superfamily hydrolase